MKNEKEVKDAALGALRYNTGKPQLRFVLTFPEAMKAIARVCEYGSRKYDLYNYMRGAPLSQYVDCGTRHLLAWWSGEDNDPESGLSHLDHFVWNAMALTQMAQAAGREIRDDRPHVVMAGQDEKKAAPAVVESPLNDPRTLSSVSFLKEPGLHGRVVNGQWVREDH
jgi:hypothetical protein